VYREDVDPDATIERLDLVTSDDVRTVARDVADDLAIAVVGPHTAADFD
jgi:predicted Zn-dependent peptidase